jgi:hypothetical protein
MGWDTNSDEYTEAFSTYNKALIEMDEKASQGIMDEMKSITDFKAGKKFNFTYVWTAVQKQLESENWEDYLTGSSSEAQIAAREAASAARERNNEFKQSIEERFAQYGAEFKDGILTLGADANIPGVISTIADLGAEYGNLLPD